MTTHSADHPSWPPLLVLKVCPCCDSHQLFGGRWRADCQWAGYDPDDHEAAEEEAPLEP